MSVPIVMPKLGMVMAEGIVASWAKSAGEPVTQGEVIAEIETEKLNYDLEATDNGIFHPVVQQGAVVAVDGLLGYLLGEGEAPPETPDPQATQSVPRSNGRPRSQAIACAGPR